MSNIDFSQMVTADAKAANRQAELRAAVTAERDRRLYAGVTVSVNGYGAVPLQGRPADQVNLLALESSARDLVEAGITGPAIPFRDAANAMHMLTPAQVLEMAGKGKAAASAIYTASWLMKDGGAIPEDYADDAHWPAA